MGRKRKLMTGMTPIGGPSLKSRRAARRVTSAYHSLRNELKSLETTTSMNEHAKDEKKRDLEAQLVAIGGTNRYQEASIIATKHFKTSRWVLSCITSYLRPPKGGDVDSKVGSSSAVPNVRKTKKEECLQVLEVGAINNQLQQAADLHVRSIDVNSQHPSIEELDFFDLPPCNSFDCVVCSMVINCVNTAFRRGEMLARLRGQLKSDNSLLLLVLPTRCIDSPHVGRAVFSTLLQVLGFTFACEVKVTPRLLFYTLRRGKLQVAVEPDEPAFPAEEEHWLRETRARFTAATAATTAAESTADKDNKAAASQVVSHFSLNYDATVPPTEFALAFTPWLLCGME